MNPLPSEGRTWASEDESELQFNTLAWAETLLSKPIDTQSRCVGLISGNREPCDIRCLVALARQLTASATARSIDASLLQIRLEVYASQQADRLIDQQDRIPTIRRSPFGNWREVNIPMPVGQTASWSLLQLPRWISTWRESFGNILIDLGPINMVPSRTIGRLCQANYLVLGPQSTGSKNWLTRHLDWHRDSGVEISGSLVAAIQTPIAA